MLIYQPNSCSEIVPQRQGFWTRQRLTENQKCRAVGIEDLDQEKVNISKASELESYHFNIVTLFEKQVM